MRSNGVVKTILNRGQKVIQVYVLFHILFKCNIRKARFNCPAVIIRYYAVKCCFLENLVKRTPWMLHIIWYGKAVCITFKLNAGYIMDAVLIPGGIQLQKLVWVSHVYSTRLQKHINLSSYQIRLNQGMSWKVPNEGC